MLAGPPSEATDVPLGQILDAQADGYGSYTIRANPDAAPPGRDLSGAAPPDMDDRVRILTALDPRLANDPTVLATIALSVIPTDQLTERVLEMQGLVEGRARSQFLGNLDGDAQRTLWEAMSAEEQRYWRNIGWDGPGGGGESLFGRALGAVAGVAGTAAHIGAEYVLKAPHTLAEQIPGFEEYVDPYTFEAISKYGVKAPLKGALKAYQTVQPIPSHVYRTLHYNERDNPTGEDRGFRALLDYDVHDWKRAWDATAKGERYIDTEHRRQALELLGDDENLYGMLVAHQAGDGIDTITEKFARINGDDPRFSDAALEVYNRINSEEAQKALSVIRRGKVSVGRDFARSLGLNEDSSLYSVASGLIDGTWTWYTDPLYLGGKALQARKAAQYSLAAFSTLDDAGQTARLAKMFRYRLDDTTGAVVAAGRPDAAFERANAQIARRFAEGDTAGLIRDFRGHPNLLGPLVRFNETQAISTIDDVRMFWFSEQARVGIASGEMLSMARKVPTVPRLTPTAMTNKAISERLNKVINWGETREALSRRGTLSLATVRDEADTIGRLRSITPEGLAAGDNLDDLDELGRIVQKVLPLNRDLHAGIAAGDVDAIRRGFTELDELGTVSGWAYGQTIIAGARQFGETRAFDELTRIGERIAARPRFLQEIERGFTGIVLGPYAGFLRSATAHVPRAGVLDLSDETTFINEFDRILSIGAYADLPAPVRKVFYDDFLRATPVGRQRLYGQYMHDLFDGLGIPQANLQAQVEKGMRRFGITDAQMHNGIVAPLDPLIDTANFVLVPDFRALMRQATKLQFMARTFGGMSDGIAAGFTAKVWSPAALLRVSFVPRAAGEEMLAFVVRHGPMSLLKGTLAKAAYDPVGFIRAPISPIEAIGRRIYQLAPGRAAALSEKRAIAAAAAVAGEIGRSQRFTTAASAALESLAGSNRVRAYALSKGDPLHRYPGLARMAESPRIASALAAVSAQHHILDEGMLVRGADDIFLHGESQVGELAFVNAPHTDDLEVAAGIVMGAGRDLDLGHANAYLRRIERMAEGPTYTAAMHATVGTVDQASWDGLLAGLATTRTSGQAGLDRFSANWKRLTPQAQDDLTRAIDQTVHAWHYDSLIDKWATEGLLTGRGSKILKDTTAALSKMTPRQRTLAMAYAHGQTPAILDASQLAEKVTAAVRGSLDDPALQAKLLNNPRYGELGERIPPDTTMLFTLSMTKEQLVALNEVLAKMTPAALKRVAASGSQADVLAAAIINETRGGALGELHRSMLRTEAGSIPLVNWATTDRALAESVHGALAEHLRRMYRANGRLSQAALDSLHLSYMHVPSSKIVSGAPERLDDMVDGALRIADDLAEYRVTGAHLTQNRDVALWQGRTLDELKNEHAGAITREFLANLTDDAGRVFHEVVEAALNGTLDLPRVAAAVGERLPKVAEKADILAAASRKGFWERGVNSGFKWIANGIDGLIRNPAFTYYYADAWTQAAPLRDRMLNGVIRAEADDALTRLSGLDDLLARHPNGLDDVADSLEDLGLVARSRLLSRLDEERFAVELNAVIDSKADELTRIIAEGGRNLDFRALGYSKRTPLSRLAETLAPEVRRIQAMRSLATMPKADRQALLRWAEHRHGVEAQVADIAGERSLAMMIPYIDNSRMRSQFQDFVKPFIPFQFAEEQFIKRWARTLTYSPQALARSSMTMDALRNVGFVTKDDQGNDIYTFPGSGPLLSVIQAVSPTVFGLDMTVPVAAAFTGTVTNSLPGLDTYGVPSVAPVASVPIHLLASRFPELGQVEKALVGRYAGQDTLDLVVPSHLRRVYEATIGFDGAARTATATRHAIAHLEAAGHGLRTGATEGEKEQYLRRVESTARWIMVTQAVLGFIAPAPPQLDFEGDLSPELRELIASGVPLPDAITAFVEQHPDADAWTVFSSRVPGGAPLPSTRPGAEYLTAHEDFLGAHTRAGGWLIPQPIVQDDDGFYRDAYNLQIEIGLRERKSPEEFLDDIIWTRAARPFFTEKDRFEADMAAAEGDTARQRQLDATFADYQSTYFAMNPIFARMYRAAPGRTRREKVREDMRFALADERLPDNSQTTAIRTLMEGWASFETGMLSALGNPTARAKRYRRQIRVAFVNWADGFVAANPHVNGYYTRILRPDAGLAETEADAR